MSSASRRETMIDGPLAECETSLMTALMRCEAPEVLRRVVVLVDLLAVLLEALGIDLGVLRLDDVARLGVDVGPLVDDLGDELGLEGLGDDVADDAEVARVVVDLDARVAH